MLFPALVDRLEKQIALQRSHQFIAELLFAAVVEGHRFVNDAVAKRLTIEVTCQHASGSQLGIESSDRHDVGESDE